MNPTRLRRLARKAVTAAWPERVWRRYDRLSRQLGLDRLYLVLSFDCDTPEDIDAVAKLHPWLSKRGIKATYAVPGEQLRQGQDVYRAVFSQGGEFINHGGLPHTAWRDGRYWSITFYDAMPQQAVIDDIRRGHEIVSEVIGAAPLGFRAPHFGHFQQPEQLALVYRTLSDLGYRYATTTLPTSALAHGPVYAVGGLQEIPVTGTYRNPYTILDSWQYIVSPYNPTLTERYAQRFTETVAALVRLGVAGILNYYVDPAHVVNQPGFYTALEYTLERGIPSLRYTDLLEQVKAEPA